VHLPVSVECPLGFPCGRGSTGSEACGQPSQPDVSSAITSDARSDGGGGPLHPGHGPATAGLAPDGPGAGTSPVRRRYSDALGADEVAGKSGNGVSGWGSEPRQPATLRQGRWPQIGGAALQRPARPGDERRQLSTKITFFLELTMKKNILGIFLTLVALEWLTPFPGSAQMTLEVSPIRAEHQIEAGASETNVIQVRNGGPKPVRVKAQAQDWQMNRKGEVAFARAGSTPGSLSAWLEINPTDFQVEPGQTKEIRYTLTIPAGARTGSYHEAILVEGMPAQPGPPNPKKMAVHGRFGVMIYETVGKPDTRAKFTDFQVLPEKRQVKFVLALANTGTSHFRPKKSKVIIKNSQGQEVAKVDIPDAPVLPGASRDVEFTQELNLPPGQYLAEAVVDAGQRDLLARRQQFTVGK
jgi:P pilus assembly chaperone PapD